MSRRLLLALVVSLALAVPAQAAAQRGFVKHEEKYWTWFGPPTWSAGSGPYGIAISDPRGTMGIDYGGASIFCDGSPAQHFAAARAGFRANSGMRNLRIRRNRFAQGNGTFFNSFEFRGRSGGRNIRGEIKFAYSFYDATYCFASGLTKAAPARGYRDSIRLLRQVTNSLAYFGPGLPPDPVAGQP